MGDFVSDHETSHQRHAFDIKKFEAKKRKIAAKLKAEEDIEKFRKETGGTIGGEWVNQKWVGNNVNDNDKDTSGFNVMLWLKDTVLYFVFLGAFTYTIFSARSMTEMAYYEDVWRRILTDHLVTARSHEGVLDFLNDVIVGELGNQDTTDFPFDTYDFKAKYGIAYGSALVGAVRVKGSTCSIVHSQLIASGLVQGTECYPGYAPGFEEIKYSKENGTSVLVNATNATVSTVKDMYTYQTDEETQQVPLEGKYATYPGSGYVSDLSLSDAQDTIRRMRDEHWIDMKTRAVIVEYMLYSPNMDLFGDTRVLFELLPSGTVESNVYVAVIALNRYPDDGIWGVIRISMLVFVYLTVIFYILDDMDTCRLEGLAKYRKFGWAHVDLANNFIFCITGIMRLANFIMVAIAFPPTATDSDVRQKIRSVGGALYLEDQFNGLNGFLLWMKLFKYVGVTARIVRLANTIILSLRDTITYLGLFVIISFAFAMLGFLLFGSSLEPYQTLTDSLVTIFRAMFGDVDFLEVLESAGSLGLLFLFAWLVVSVTVLLNMIIAILADVYSNVLRDEASSPTTAMMEKFWEDLVRKKDEYFGKYGKVSAGDEIVAKEAKEKEIEDQEDEPKTRMSRFLHMVKNVASSIKLEAQRRIGKEGAVEAENERADQYESDTSSEEDDDEKNRMEIAAEKEKKSGATSWKPWPSRQVVPLDVTAASLSSPVLSKSMYSTPIQSNLEEGSPTRK